MYVQSKNVKEGKEELRIWWANDLWLTFAMQLSSRWKINNKDTKTIKDMKILLEMTRSIFQFSGKKNKIL